MNVSKKVVVLCAALTVPVLLNGCGKNIVVTADTFCEVMDNQPVCVSKDDVLTEGTATKIEGLGRATSKLCKPVVPCRGGIS